METALDVATRYESARSSGNGPAAWALLSAYSREMFSDLSAFQATIDDYNSNGGAEYMIDPPSQNPDLLSPEFLGAVYSDLAANSILERAWLVSIRHPEVQGASAGTTVLVVAPVEDIWAVWIGH